jgi:hypothetical protein
MPWALTKRRRRSPVIRFTDIVHAEETAMRVTTMSTEELAGSEKWKC